MARVHEEDGLLAEINVTPFVDVVLVLLVIFMVTSSIVFRPAIPIRLPEAATAEGGAADAVVVMVTSDGRYFVGATQVEETALAGELRARLAGYGGKGLRVVRVEADEGADVGPAIRAVDAARIAGAEAATIATRPEGSP